LLRSIAVSDKFQEVDLSDIVYSSFLNLRLDAERTQDFEGLVSSVKRYGLLEPLIVRPKTLDSHAGMGYHQYELVCGHRRLAACRKLSIKTVPCIIKEMDDKQALEVALADNIQRQSLDPIEEAEAFKLYVVSFGRGSVTALARKIGKSEEYVSHRLLLLGLPKELKDRISSRLLNPAHATELVWLRDREKQLQLADEIQKRNLTLRQTRRIANLMKSGTPLAQAVKKIIQNEPRLAEETASLDNVSEILSNEPDEAWQVSLKNNDELAINFKLLDNMILVLRTALAGIDLLISKTEDAELRTFLLRSRLRLHETLDEAIRKKK
jgi:ParB family chromosome partitioning protein